MSAAAAADGADAADAADRRSPAAGEKVAVEALTRRYGDLVAVDGISFRVDSGEMFGLIGPDGAGKTTTLRTILGLLAPHGGTVRTCGLDPIRHGARLSRRIGYLSQRFSLYGDLSVDENVAFFAAIHGVRDWRPRRDQLLDRLRMTPFRGRLADRLSGGMKQKLALACTLVHTPELLVMDEPTTGVDPVSRRDFWRILTQLQGEGLTILLTTPYLDEAERCQRVALMDRGRLLVVDAPEALRAAGQGHDQAMVELIATPKQRAAELLAGRADVAEVEAFGERLHATLRGVTPAAAGAACDRLAADLAAGGVEVQAARPIAPSLEDIFIARIRATQAAGQPPPPQLTGVGAAAMTALGLVCMLLSGAPAAASQTGGDAGAPAPAAAPPAVALGSAVRLTLAEALARARDASAHLAELRSLTAAAAAGLTGARAERLPQVDVSAGYTRLSDVPTLAVDLPGAGLLTVFPNIPDNYRSHLGLALPLYTGGRITGNVTANAQQLAAASQDAAGGRAELALETATAYWNLLTSRDSERVLAESLAAFDAHLKEARDRHDAGLAASNEVLAVAVQHDQAELARLQAANAAAVANANLLRLLDLPPDARIDPTEPLAEPAPTAAEPAQSPPSLGGQPARLTDAGGQPAPAALAGAAPTPEILAAATAARPEILALRSRIAANRAAAGAVRAALRPQASLSGGYDYADPNPRILPLEDRWRTSWSIGATVSLSLFDGGRTAAAAAQIDAQADALAHRLDDLERHVRLEVTQRVLDLATARQAAVVAARSLDSAQENVRVAHDRYHEGVIPSSELLDAETALLRAGLDRTAAQAQVRLALANLDRALGR
jgi:ABC-2 type transport system ATP-binding protein